MGNNITSVLKSLAAILIVGLATLFTFSCDSGNEKQGTRWAVTKGTLNNLHEDFQARSLDGQRTLTIRADCPFGDAALSQKKTNYWTGDMELYSQYLVNTACKDAKNINVYFCLAPEVSDAVVLSIVRCDNSELAYNLSLPDDPYVKHAHTPFPSRHEQ